MRALVIGAGIAGLTAALKLHAYPKGSNGAAQGILDAEALAAALGEAGADVATALVRYEAARRPATAAVVLSNRQFGPERVLQLVDERIRGPEDDIAAVVTREELEDITRRYRRIAGFDVETLNRKSGREHEQREAAA